MQKRKALTIDDVKLGDDVESLFVLEFAKDLDVSRAAETCRVDVNWAYELLGRNDVAQALRGIMLKRAEMQRVDPEWLMQEWQSMYELAKQHRQFSVAVQCLKEVGRLGTVDAYAPEKVEVKGDREIAEKLARARNRRANITQVVSFKR